GVVMRTIVSFEPLGDQTVIRLEQAPTDIDGIGDNDVVDVSPVACGSLVEEGKALLARLSAHPPVNASLTAALQRQAVDGPAPPSFGRGASGAEALPWERLYAEGHGFCALDPRWTIGGVARLPRDLDDGAFEPPLRLVAVLSAGADRSGLPQVRDLIA